MIIFKVKPTRLVGTMLCLLLGYGPSGAFAEIPTVNKNQVKSHQTVMKQFPIPIYQDAALHEYANQLAKKISEANGLEHYDWKVFIMDSDQVNAFTPGDGLLYFFRGLINLFTTEGQFAAILAHEMGHNTKRHRSRGDTKRRVGNLGEFLATVLTGNSATGSAIAIANAEKERAFQRELELEADEEAAKFLFNAGYAPEEMIDGLSIMKDYTLLMDKIQETQRSHYHGLFDTHPATDKRLRQLVDQAGELPPGEAFRGRAEIREYLNGMIFGPNFDGNKREDQERYLNKGLGITFLYPDDWTKTLKGSRIILKDADQTIQLKIEIEKTKDKSLDSIQVLNAKYPSDLEEVAKIDKNATKDLGSIGRYRPDSSKQLVAAISVGRNTYHFLGIARNNQLTSEQELALVEIIASFRRATREDISPTESKRLAFKRLEPGESFATLAKSRELGKYTEEYLRVLNGYYPKGEPEPGTYVKIVESAKEEEDEE